MKKVFANVTRTLGIPMIPIRDTVPHRTRPVVNTVLILANIALFLYQLTLPALLQERLIYTYGVIPSRFLPFHPLHLFGEGLSLLFPLLTSLFLHSGWTHLIFNMWFLWIFGDNVEDRLGHSRYLGFYLFAGFSASFLHILFNASSRIPVIGASGAIAGVMAAYLLLFPYSRILTLIPVFVFIPLFIEIPAYLFILFWFMTQLLSGTVSLLSLTSGGIAWWAHVGGFLAGIFVVLRVRKREKRRYVNPSLYS